MNELPPAFWYVTWTLFGLIVGSFQNAAIHRLPREGLTMSSPKRSQCPKCGAQLTWRENLPLFSWLLQRGRCRSCKAPIHWRYPAVEVLNAGLFVLVAWATGPELGALLLVQFLVVGALVVATFVDFEFFEIPDEISIGGMWLAPLACLLVPELHDDSWIAQELTDPVAFAADGVDRIASLAAGLAGMAVGGGVLIAIGRLGSALYGRDAMGFGDVKLLAAAGGFIGPGGALIALFLASIAASVAGLANMVRFFLLLRRRARERDNPKPVRRHLAMARIAGRYLPFGPYLGLGIGVVLVAWKNVSVLLQSAFQPF